MLHISLFLQDKWRNMHVPGGSRLPRLKEATSPTSEIGSQGDLDVKDATRYVKKDCNSQVAFVLKYKLTVALHVDPYSPYPQLPMMMTYLFCMGYEYEYGILI